MDTKTDPYFKNAFAEKASPELIPIVEQQNAPDTVAVVLEVDGAGKTNTSKMLSVLADDLERLSDVHRVSVVGTDICADMPPGMLYHMAGDTRITGLRLQA